ncbi:Glycosyltransferase involved in cell wall bisynthesis [Paenibacillus sp. UNCCL117]|uniref:glycosyltransferase family 4 protein n=1 Tax=unclassified Paenibacillus TaxID=185978 RepID=UPI000888FFB5|nr:MULTISPECIES: glycosyltransferase family 4 protein [unclassified Paenibacillus]SDC55403.1 Glycosyltransferase involved in cell wall bisynthesis [Paenibacillus sp. cl123]SFW10935.1 Glycosyltransferase involved in cell wall bisynthesis [Paenibacillus sp. UNCCL117]
MKILLASFWEVPSAGGVWSYMEHLASELKRTGHQVDLFGRMNENAFHLVNQNRIFSNAPLLPSLYRKINLTNIPVKEDHFIYKNEMYRYCMELHAALLNLNQYDVIHAQDVIAARSIRTVLKEPIPLVTTIHGSLLRKLYLQTKAVIPNYSEDEFKKTPEYHYYSDLERIGLESAEITITPSIWLKNYFHNQYPLPHINMQCVHNGINEEKFQANLEKYQYPLPSSMQLGKKILICTSRLIYAKGIHILIDALSKLKLHTDDWVCWLCGEGYMEKALKLQCTALGLDSHVLFLGQRTDVAYLFTLADIFVCPSINDNYPYAAMEAQWSGKPSVVSDAGGLPELIEDTVTGLCFPSENSEILYSQLFYLLANEGVRITMGMEAKKRARSYLSTRRMMNELNTIYEQVRAR